ncbi:MAG: sulfotransferase [Deltaproteobacteria bacterium]|nr:sulfotransferase [Deltaproteobacteria bacterium]
MGQPTLTERLRFRAQYQVWDPFTRRLREPYWRWRNAGRTYRPIFVSGVMGSGTSLLAVALGQRFDVAGVVYESARLAAKSSFLYVPTMAAFASIAEYEARVRSDASWEIEIGRRDLLALYRAYGSGTGEWIVDKGPNTSLLRAGFLARCFPDARFVLIFRDPVANVEGFRRKWPTFGRESPEANAHFWMEAHEQFLRETEPLRERVRVIDYNALATRYDQVLDALGRDLGLAVSTRPGSLRTRPNIEGYGIRNVARSRIGVVQDADRRAIERVDPAEAEAIRALTGPLTDRLRARARESAPG